MNKHANVLTQKQTEEGEVMLYQTQESFANLNREIEKLVAKLDYRVIKKARWFREKTAEIRQVSLMDYGLLSSKPNEEIVLAAIVRLNLRQNNGKEMEALYYLPLLISRQKYPEQDVFLKVKQEHYQAYLYDGVHSLAYNQALEELLTGKRILKMAKGGLLQATLLKAALPSSAQVLTNVSSNSLTLLLSKKIVKTYRKLQAGINPDLELSSLLYQKSNFRSFPRIQAYVSYRSVAGETFSICLIEDYVANQGSVWAYSQKFLESYLFSELWQEDDLLAFLKEMEELGQLIAELHLALAAIPEADFYPADISWELYCHWLLSIKKNAQYLLNCLRKVETEWSSLAAELLAQEELFLKLPAAAEKFFPYLGKRIRVHGDLHLEQIIKTSRGFLVLDFEGEPLKSLGVRRKKQSPLKDIAGMLRSFNYAAYSVYFKALPRARIQEDLVLSRLQHWEEKVINSFLKGYINKVRGEREELLPPEDKLYQILALFKLDKALYEGIYELNNRPDWLAIPLKGILACLGELANE